MRIIPFLFVLFVGFGVFAQAQESTPADQNGPKIEFKETLHEFGEINQGDRVEHKFTYYNTGTEPLIISNVRTSCGCTAPNWSREPLVAGDSAVLTVRFNSTGKSNMQNKIITVSSNAVNSSERIRITANVLVKPAEAKEENSQP